MSSCLFCRCRTLLFCSCIMCDDDDRDRWQRFQLVWIQRNCLNQVSQFGDDTTYDAWIKFAEWNYSSKLSNMSIYFIGTLKYFRLGTLPCHADGWRHIAVVDTKFKGNCCLDLWAHKLLLTKLSVTCPRLLLAIRRELRRHKLSMAVIIFRLAQPQYLRRSLLARSSYSEMLEPNRTRAPREFRMDRIVNSIPFKILCILSYPKGFA